MSFFKRLFGNKNQEEQPGPIEIAGLLESGETDQLMTVLNERLTKISNYGDSLEKLNEAQKVFYLNQSFEQEINNGGFDQFFFNSSGQYSAETLNSLKAINAFKMVDLLQKAIDQFPNSTVPMDEDVRRSTLIQMGDKASEFWNELDQLFYQYPDNLYELNIEYIKKNLTQF